MILLKRLSEFVRILAFGLAGILLSNCQGNSATINTEQNEISYSTPPNILLITSEDHGSHLSSYGDTVIYTPNLDKIARDGMLFTNAYVTTSSCSPSRSSILTGLYPHQNGHLDLATYGYHLVGNVKNIYELLKTGGYRTGMIGKLHVNPESNFPIDFHPIKDANFKKTGLGRYAEYAGDFFKESQKPFFLMVNFPDAHGPWQDTVENRPRPAKIVTGNDVAVFPYVGFENGRIQNFTANYYNSIQRLDENVGELMQTLLNSGKAGHTLVIYLSDHGDQMPRGKLDVYEASTKVPFLVKWPGKIQKGIISDALISSTDIMPTVLEAAGLSIPEKLAGKSLLPLFNDPELHLRQHLFTEYHGFPTVYFPRRAVRDKQYKLIYTLLKDNKNPVAKYYTEHWYSAAFGSPTVEELETAADSTQKAYHTWLYPPEIQLYDLENDPWEFYDIASDPAYAQIKGRLLKRLVQWQEETDDPLRFPEKLNELTAEHDALTVQNSRGKSNWKYPEYLYGIENPSKE